RAGSPDVLHLTARARLGEALADEELAALFLSPQVSTADLLALAHGRRAAADPHIETFSPLYLTNECDAACRMCGMRGSNAALVRETADAPTVAAQLAVLRRRGLRAVALLTVEYHHGPLRQAMIGRAAEALGEALAHGFAHVLVN